MSYSQCTVLSKVSKSCTVRFLQGPLFILLCLCPSQDQFGISGNQVWICLVKERKTRKEC